MLAVLCEGKGPGDLVFTSPRGGLLGYRTFRRRAFDPAAAGIGVPDLTPHKLRHSAASLAISSGANVKVVQQMLGHTSAAMTLDLYGHLFADDLDAVAARLDQARASALAEQDRNRTGTEVVTLIPDEPAQAALPQ
jgi:integrase